MSKLNLEAIERRVKRILEQPLILNSSTIKPHAAMKAAWEEFHGLVTPEVVLALVARVRELEAKGRKARDRGFEEGVFDVSVDLRAAVARAADFESSAAAASKRADEWQEEDGRKPWSWASLAGLRTDDGCRYQQQALPKTPEWRAWITSERMEDK